jgi:hypothetical protein
MGRHERADPDVVVGVHAWSTIFIAGIREQEYPRGIVRSTMYKADVKEPDRACRRGVRGAARMACSWGLPRCRPTSPR